MRSLLQKVAVPEGRSGDWAIEHFTVEDGIALWRIRRDGRTGPTPGETYTRLVRDKAHEPMMSDVPDEIRDHVGAVCEMKERGGRILINGLGLGMVLKAALKLPNVTSVDVVEIEQDIINLVWPTYASDPRAHIHHADAFTIDWPKGTRWSVAWHDIWPNICTDNLEGMGRLHRKYGRRVDWQGSWQREQLQYKQRQEKAQGWW